MIIILTVRLSSLTGLKFSTAEIARDIIYLTYEVFFFISFRFYHTKLSEYKQASVLIYFLYERISELYLINMLSNGTMLLARFHAATVVRPLVFAAPLTQTYFLAYGNWLIH